MVKPNDKGAKIDNTFYVLANKQKFEKELLGRNQAYRKLRESGFDDGYTYVAKVNVVEIR